jgi:hypothetical protein
MKNPFILLIGHLLFLVVIGVMFLLSYKYTVCQLSKAYSEMTTKKELLVRNIVGIQQLSSEKQLTLPLIMKYDETHNTSIINSIDNKQVFTASVTNEMISPIAIQDASRKIEQQYVQENKKAFWDYMPSLPILIFTSLGLFFAKIITNFGDLCFKCVSSIVKKMARNRK